MPKRMLAVKQQAQATGTQCDELYARVISDAFLSNGSRITIAGVRTRVLAPAFRMPRRLRRCRPVEEETRNRAGSPASRRRGARCRLRAVRAACRTTYDARPFGISFGGAIANLLSEMEIAAEIVWQSC